MLDNQSPRQQRGWRPIRLPAQSLRRLHPQVSGCRACRLNSSAPYIWNIPRPHDLRDTIKKNGLHSTGDGHRSTPLELGVGDPDSCVVISGGIIERVLEITWGTV